MGLLVVLVVCFSKRGPNSTAVKEEHYAFFMLTIHQLNVHA